MACDDRQLTDAQKAAAFDQQRTGVLRAIRPFSGEATAENLVDYLNRELVPVVKQAREKVNEVFLQVKDNAPSGNPLGYYFSTNTTNADPTAGRIRLDNATQDLATTIRVSQSNGRLVDVASWLDVMAGSATAPLGVVTLTDAVNPGRFVRFDLDSMTDQGAYWDLSVTPVESSHDNPFANDGAVVLSFIPGVGADAATVPVTSISPVTGPTLLGLETGTGAPEALTGAEAGQLIKRSNDISATITTDQNDWAPTGLETASVIFIGTSGNTVTITGIDGSAIEELEGTFFFATVTGSTGRVKFANNSASSVSGNRLLTPISGGNTFGIGPQEWCIILRNGILWYVMPCAPLLTGPQLGLRIRYTGEISPTIAVNTNDWNPTGLSTAYSIKAALTGSRLLTGIDSTVFVDDAAGNTADGVQLLLKNNDAVDSLTLSNNSISSASGNRFNAGTPAINVVLDPGWTAQLTQESGFWVPRVFFGPIADDSMVVNISGATNIARGRLLSAMVDNGISWNAATHVWEWDGLEWSWGGISQGNFREIDFFDTDTVALSPLSGALGFTYFFGLDVVADWADILANGNNSGANNPHIDTGQFIGFGVEADVAAIGGQIRADAVGLIIRSLGNVLIDQSGGGALQLASSNVVLDNENGTIVIRTSGASGGSISINSNSHISLRPATGEFVVINDPGMLRFDEQASSSVAVTAGFGALWVKNTAPTQAWFTDDTDVDHQLAYERAASDTESGFIEIATDSEMEAGSDTTRAVTPGRQHSHPGSPKFWAHVTVSGGVATLAASYNVSSVTRSSAGRLTINVATDFSSTNWCVGCSVESSGEDALQVCVDNDARAAGSIAVFCLDIFAALADPVAYNVWGFGDQ